MHDNAVKAKLRRGECVYGTSLEDCLSPEMPVVLAAAGLDFFFVDTEHSPASYGEIQALCRTAHDRGIVPLVRVTENLPHLISRALDVGASGVIVPRLKSAEEARAIVKCVKFPPRGERGFGLRSVNTDLKGGPAPAAIESCNQETMVVAMIETREAVEAVEKIATVKGVDALFIGPYDLSLSLGTPNACTTAGCHADKGDRWAAEATAKWYGLARRPHYGTVIAAARRADPSALTLDALVTLTQDRLSPTIVRATAVSLLGRYPGSAAAGAVAQSLEDEESIVRHAAVEGSDALAPEDRIRRLSPLVQDPVKAVRAAAARALAETPGFSPGPDEAPRFQSAIAEFEAAMRHLLDFTSSGFNLGNLYAAQRRPADAEQYYRVALRIDPLFFRARVNYAMLLAGQGRLADAERELRAAAQAEPNLVEARYNLGLLLAETSRLKEAVAEFERVVRADPRFTRAHYNLALAERDRGRLAAARASLDRALAIEPDNGDILFAVVDLLVRQNRLDEARKTAERWAERLPNDPRARDILTRLSRTGLR